MLGTMDPHNGMMLFTLSISLHDFAFGFSIRFRNNGDVFVT